MMGLVDISEINVMIMTMMMLMIMMSRRRLMVRAVEMILRQALKMNLTESLAQRHIPWNGNYTDDHHYNHHCNDDADEPK